MDVVTETVPDRTKVYLGNREAISIIGGERVKAAGYQKRCTTVVLRPDVTLIEALGELTGPQGLWQAHSDAPAPAWVAAEGPLAEGLITLLTAQYPGIEVRDPEPDHGTETT
jgi:hypothetical protein